MCTLPRQVSPRSLATTVCCRSCLEREYPPRCANCISPCGRRRFVTDRLLPFDNGGPQGRGSTHRFARSEWQMVESSVFSTSCESFRTVITPKASSAPNCPQQQLPVNLIAARWTSSPEPGSHRFRLCPSGRDSLSLALQANCDISKPCNAAQLWLQQRPIAHEVIADHHLV